MVSKLAVDLLAKQAKEVYRGEATEQLKLNIANLECTLTQLSFELENGEHLITEKCNEIKRRIQLMTEKRLEEIKQHSDSMFKRIDTFQEKSIQKYNEMKEQKKQVEHLVNEVNSLIQKQKTYLKQFVISDKETMTFNQQLQEMKLKVDKERENNKNEIFSSQPIIFEANQSPICDDLLGMLTEKATTHTVIFY